MRNNAISFRSALLSYRDGAKVHLGTRPSSERDAKLADEMPPLLQEAMQIMDHDDSFDAFLFGLESLLQGFERQLVG